MSLPTTSYAVLGLLSMSPASGYELAQHADLSIANFWPISKSQVYSELARLEDLGFVRGTDVEQDKLPDKRTYELTPAGAEALDAWLVDPSLEGGRTRIGFLVKVFFGHRLDRRTFVALIERYRDAADRQRAYLQEIVDSLEGLDQAWYARTTALYGLRGVEASIAWADEVLETMPSRLRMPKDARARTAELFDRVPGRKRT